MSTCRGTEDAAVSIVDDESPAADVAAEAVAPPPASPAGPPSAFRRRAMLILWPAFLAAGVLTMLTFVVVDPATLAFFGEAPLDWPRAGLPLVHQRG